MIAHQRRQRFIQATFAKHHRRQKLRSGARIKYFVGAQSAFVALKYGAARHSNLLLPPCRALPHNLNGASITDASAAPRIVQNIAPESHALGGMSGAWQINHRSQHLYHVATFQTNIAWCFDPDSAPQSTLTLRNSLTFKHKTLPEIAELRPMNNASRQG